MSSASFSTSSSRREERGFSDVRLQDFLARGNQLTNRRATNGRAISSFKPKELTRTTTTTRSSAGGLARAFGAADEGSRTTVSGFLGKFATGITSEQLDALTNTFLQRQRSIKQRRAQPGRSALFLSRT